MKKIILPILFSVAAACANVTAATENKTGNRIFFMADI